MQLREELERSEKIKALFLRLLRSQRGADDADGVMATVAEELGRHLGVNRVGFFEMRDSHTLACGQSWTDGALPALSGLFPASGLGTGYLAEVRAGRTRGIGDTASDPLTADSRFGDIGACAVIYTPIVREDRWIGGVYVHHGQPRPWAEREVRLVREAADQTWDAVERARAVAALRDSLATVGHELRSPLAAIRYSAEAARALLPEAGEAGRQLEHAIRVIDQQSRHITRLVNDLLDVTRISRNKLQLRLVETDLRRCVRDTVTALTPVFEETGVTVALQLPDHPLWLEVDPDRFQQMLGNLLRNAVAYSHPGDQVVLAADQRGEAVEICVRDSGIGIDPGQLGTLFEPYRQLDSRGGGLGLGLALVKRLVELHGGTVSVHSEGAGSGSAFTLLLPMRQ